MAGFELKQIVKATGIQTLFAFLDAEAIQKWWKASAAVVQPRPGGLFMVQWDGGPMAGVLGGILDNSQAGHFVHYGALHWMSNGKVESPGRLEIDLMSKNNPRRAPTLITITGEAFASEEFARQLQESLKESMARLATYCENEAPEQPDPHIMGVGESFLAEAKLQRRRIS